MATPTDVPCPEEALLSLRGDVFEHGIVLPLGAATVLTEQVGGLRAQAWHLALAVVRGITDTWMCCLPTLVAPWFSCAGHPPEYGG